MEKNKLVYIVILNWNSLYFLKKCLESIKKYTIYNNYRALIVDNGSKDRSIEWAQKNYPEIEVINNKKNIGYAAGNNIGIRHSIKNEAEYVVLINPDVKVRKGWLSKLIEIGESSEAIGVVGPLIYDYDGKYLNKVNYCVNDSLSQDIKYGNLKLKYNVEWVEGCCMAIKSNCINRVGLFDPKYFLYWEELDWQRRVRFKDIKIVQAASSQVCHYERGSEKDIYITKYYYLRNKLYYILKDPFNSNLKNFMNFHVILFSTIRSSWEQGYYKTILISPIIYLWNFFNAPVAFFKKNRLK